MAAIVCTIPGQSIRASLARKQAAQGQVPVAGTPLDPLVEEDDDDTMTVLMVMSVIVVLVAWVFIGLEKGNWCFGLTIHKKCQTEDKGKQSVIKERSEDGEDAVDPKKAIEAVSTREILFSLFIQELRFRLIDMKIVDA